MDFRWSAHDGGLGRLARGGETSLQRQPGARRAMHWIGPDGPDEGGQVLTRAHPLELAARLLEPRRDTEPTGLVAVPGARQELRQAAGVPLPERHVALLLHDQALVVPVAREQRLPGEQRADLGVARVLSLEAAVGHDVEERL